MLLNRDSLDLYHKWKLSHRLARRSKAFDLSFWSCNVTLAILEEGGFLLAVCCLFKVGGSLVSLSSS